MLNVNKNFYKNQPANSQSTYLNTTRYSANQKDYFGPTSYETSATLNIGRDRMLNTNANSLKDQNPSVYGASYNNQNLYSNYSYAPGAYIPWNSQPSANLYDTHNNISSINTSSVSRKTNTYQSHFDYKMYQNPNYNLGMNAGTSSAPIGNYNAPYPNDNYNQDNKRKKTQEFNAYAGNASNNFVSAGYLGHQNNYNKNANAKNAVQPMDTTNNAGPQSFYGRDASYPDDLNKLLTPVHCDLCGVELNSVVSAKIHYDSKAHDRNLTNWFFLNYVSKGLELPQFKHFYQGSSITEKELHCKVCDLRFTSPVHSKQHYEGRRHRLALERKEKGEQGEGGSYDGRKIAKAKQPADSNLRCDLCSVDTTSMAQMAVHLQGANHQRRLKLASVVGDVDFACNENDSILALAVQDQVKSDIDLTPYRKDNGEFYCEICNANLNHETILRKHLFGKKHLKKESEMKMQN